MTEAQADLLHKARNGIAITASDVCRTITSPEELDGYRDGLKRRGALNGDAISAIEDRRHAMAMGEA